MKLLPEDRERLIKYVDFMKSEFADFSKFSKVDWKTYNDDRDTIKKFIQTSEPIYKTFINKVEFMLQTQ